MERFFGSPHLVDLVLGFTVVEAIVLTVLRRRRRHGADPAGDFLRPMGIVLLLLPGVCLMLALRAALAGAAWPWVPAALGAALVAHLADIRERWR